MALRLSRRPKLAALPALLALLAAFALWQAPAASAAPQLTLSQASGLANGQTIKVTGAGFNPSIGLFVAMCDTSVPNGGACDMAFFKPVSTDAAGAFSVFLKVYDTFGVTNCAAKPCGIQTSWVENPKDRSQEATVAVSFAAPAPPPAHTTSSSAAAPPPPPAPPTTSVAASPTAQPPASVTPTAAPQTPTSVPTVSSEAAPSTVGSAPGAGNASPVANNSDSGGSALPWVLVIVAVVVIGGGAGGYWFVRKRGSGTPGPA